MQKITDIIELVVEGMDYELLGVEYTSNRICVYIDHENGIGIEDCANVSRQLTAALEVEFSDFERYELEVSSPGVERPLFTLPHYERFLGTRAFIKLKHPVDNRKQFKGKLLKVVGDNVVIECDDNEVSLSFSNIEKAHLLAKF